MGGGVVLGKNKDMIKTRNYKKLELAKYRISKNIKRRFFNAHIEQHY